MKVEHNEMFPNLVQFPVCYILGVCRGSDGLGVRQGSDGKKWEVGLTTLKLLPTGDYLHLVSC